MGPLRRLLPVAVGVLALLAPVSADARERAIPDPDAVVGAVEIADTVIERGPARAAAVSRAREYRTASGEALEVEVSGAYPANPEADQALVDFLASRLHGDELGSLSVYVATPREIARICGGAQAVACYAVHEQRMYVPGEEIHGVPIEYALTHEYGHHVAAWRSNDPWNALDWGGKHWSSAMRVCAYVDEGKLFPGNQGRHYLRDPGEGFADGYAHVHYPEAPWQYSSLLRPDRTAYAAIRRDVLHPWTGPRSRTFRGRLVQGRSRSFKVRIALDGDMTLRMALPRGASADLEVRSPGFAAGHTVSGRGELGVEWCRSRRVETATLTVRARKGSGPFSLRVSWPG